MHSIKRKWRLPRGLNLAFQEGCLVSGVSDREKDQTNETRWLGRGGTMQRICIFTLWAALLLTSIPAMSQHRGDRRGEFWDGAGREVRGSRDYRNNSRYRDNRRDRDDYRRDRDRRDRNDYRRDRDRRDRDDGGIGPGKGALIGGAGGAALGAIFGGGLKGTIIGGAAGAGIGAIFGKVNKDNDRRRRRRYE